MQRPNPTRRSFSVTTRMRPACARALTMRPCLRGRRRRCSVPVHPVLALGHRGERVLCLADADAGVEVADAELEIEAAEVVDEQGCQEYQDDCYQEPEQPDQEVRHALP